jgi:hypothetical protein
MESRASSPGHPRLAARDAPFAPPAEHHAVTALEWLYGERLCLCRLRGMERDHCG